MKRLWWGLTFGFLVLGAVGYLEGMLGWQWGRATSSFLLVVFLVLSILQIILGKIAEQRQAQEFYDQEIVQCFPHETSQELLKFFPDQSGNQCVAITLEREPIQKSVRLWEGGYDAPPITLAFAAGKKTVIFRHSAYSCYEKYLAGGPMYQVRYFPKK